MRLPRTLLARRRLLGSAALLLAARWSRPSLAAVPTGDAAEKVVQRLVERVWGLLADGRMDQDDLQRLLPALEEETDLDLLARLSLGRYWRRATPAQQTEYVALFRRYVLQNFARRLQQFAGAEIGAPEEHFQIVASHPVGDRDVVVESRLLPPSRPPFEVDWRLRERQSEPVIIDLVVEGISLLVTQRSEFAAVMERSGMDGLLAQLRSRVAEPV
ncbi:MAG: MlaC/ttg2D family ABC transporter substrate-binding protein [Geminicoccaceae bacterium]